MNVLLWIFQILLALHTAMGAVWKFSHSVEQTMPSLSAIPGGVWLGMSVVELLCALALIVPAFNKRLAILAPVAAACIAVEMLIFSGLHLFPGTTDYAPVIYWLVVATLCGFIARGRFVRLPLNGSTVEQRP